MRYVLDASVAVAAAHPSEPTHAAALGRVARVLHGDDDIVVPTLFPIEIGTRRIVPADAWGLTACPYSQYQTARQSPAARRTMTHRFCKQIVNRFCSDVGSISCMGVGNVRLA